MNWRSCGEQSVKYKVSKIIFLLDFLSLDMNFSFGVIENK